MERKLPCEECCKIKETCCRNPQILWNIEELDDMISEYGIKTLKGKAVFKGEIPGHVYLIEVDADNHEKEITLDYCSFYDKEKENCSVYNRRPSVCRTYGDPKYNSCPFEAFGESPVGTLTEFAMANPEVVGKMHLTAGQHPMEFMEDFIQPFVERFLQSNPEYINWWEGLPRANFKRNFNIMEGDEKNV